jgi:hypothetical protein
MNNVTIDIDDMIYNIFTKPPQESKTILLSFDVSSEYELFQNLVHFLTDGLKLLYADEKEIVNLEYLTEDKLSIIKKYFLSIGFVLNCNIEQVLNLENMVDSEELPRLNTKDKNSYINTEDKHVENKNELTLFYFTLKTTNIKYEISFDYL